MKEHPQRMELKSKLRFNTNISVYYKADWLKKQIEKEIGFIKPNDLELALRRISHYYYNYRKYLDSQDTRIYDVLNKIKVHPKTALTWISFTLLPEDIKNRKKIAVKKAIRIAENRNKEYKARLGLEIIDDIQKAIERLK